VIAWNFPPYPGPDDPAGRFAWFIDRLRQSVAERGRFIPAALLMLIWNRLGNMARRFVAVAARVRAGTLRPPRPRPPRPAADETGGKPRPPYERLPRRHAWLCTFVPEAGAWGAVLQQLLGEPQMRALLAEAPQLYRILRPLCWMLALDEPGLVPPPPPTTRRARPAKPPRAAAPKPPRAGRGPRMIKLSDSISVPAVGSKNRA
jgi:hypothetical protein